MARCGRRNPFRQFRTSEYPVKQVVVRLCQQGIESDNQFITEVVFVAIEKAGQNQIIFEHPAPRPPPKATALRRVELVLEGHARTVRRHGEP